MKNWNIDTIEKMFSKPLPGEDAQLKMAPPYRGKFTKEEVQQFKPKVAAVLVLLYRKNDEWHLVFTERMQYEGVHSGQISFPGGKREEGEELHETALREAFEEVGVNPEQVKIIGNLTDLYVPPSNFSVYPFVGIVEQQIDFIKQDSEVNQILEIPVSFFLSDENISETEIIIRDDLKFSVPAYIYEEKVIWGATAIILSELSELLRNNQ